MQAQLAKMEGHIQKLLVASAQAVEVTPTTTTISPSTSVASAKSTIDPYLFGAVGELLDATTTRSQASGKLRSPPATMVGPAKVRHIGPSDNIGQVCLPQSFGLKDITSTSERIHIGSPKDTTSSSTNCVWDLAIQLL